MPRVFQVDDSLEGVRLTKALSLRIQGLSIRKAKELVDRGRVFLDEKRVLKGSRRLEAGMTVEVHLDEPESARRVVLRPESLLWESADLVVVNKPAGIPVFGSHGVTEGTLVPLIEEILVRSASRHRGDRLVLVHRLDRDTTGALVLAKNQKAAQIMVEQFRRRIVKKRYLVLASGTLSHKDRFECTVPVGSIRDQTCPDHEKRRAKTARTTFRILERFDRCALLEAIPETGRTHQIRVHLAAMGAPVLGDIEYGPRHVRDPLFRAVPRQMLHAWRIGFEEPGTGSWVEVEAPLPEDMEEVLRVLRGQKAAEN
jgi:23S rRNA pseudouridine1911/1915/1917 synthase